MGKMDTLPAGRPDRWTNGRRPWTNGLAFAHVATTLLFQNSPVQSSIHSFTMTLSPIISAEGWHVLHLFYKVEHGQWQLLDAAERRAAKTRLSELVQEI